MSLHAICFDTETSLIQPGLPAPPVVCVQWCEVHVTDGALVAHDPEIITWRDATEWAHWAIDQALGGVLIVGHNVSYDLGVLCAHVDDETFTRNVFRAYAENRVTDTMWRQKLADIGRGIYRLKQYDLGNVGERHGLRVDKADPWRLRYWQLRDVPLSEWPADAISYALNDARATAAAYIGQETKYDPRLLVQQYDRARAYWGLDLESGWGLRTSPEGVVELERGTRARLADVQTLLQETPVEIPGSAPRPLVRADGSRDTKAAVARMVAVCVEDGRAPKRTATYKEAIKAGKTPRDDEYISLDKDACDTSGDPLLESYAEYSALSKVISTDVTALRLGLVAPIHTHYDLADTCRTTSSSPNVQNFRKYPGIREAFVPRPGHVYYQADYAGLELYTFSQVAIAMFGYSHMGDALRSGKDVHSMLACTITGIDYDEGMRLKKEHDAPFTAGRQVAKVGNFGRLGGMGDEKFILSARKQGVILTPEMAKEVGRGMKATWPEMPEYHRWASVETRNGNTLLECPITGFLRDGVGYTDRCNTPFQHLAACVATRAVFLVAQACYTRQPCAACDGAANGCEWCRPCVGPGVSPLYGSRPVAFIHDEIFGECVEPWGHECAHELGRLMVRAGAPYLPDVPPTCEPQLMAYWSKDAKEVWKDGRLVPWNGKIAA